MVKTSFDPAREQILWWDVRPPKSELDSGGDGPPKSRPSLLPSKTTATLRHFTPPPPAPRSSSSSLFLDSHSP
ncbi:hypothetical protein NL676_027931 [Syzygium grande]|nr:hypothetical protein NL676_027931 [Syzygium grande]